MTKYCYIKIQREIKIVDGKETWNRFELSDDCEWCCELVKKEFALSEDGKFGIIQEKYVYGDWEYDYTIPIICCPFCGAEIVLEHLEDVIKTGKTVYDVEEKVMKIKKNKRIEWDDGTVEKDKRFIKSIPLSLDKE